MSRRPTERAIIFLWPDYCAREENHPALFFGS